MNELPLQGIYISDFRRLEGHRTLPLNAPVVLLHGPNGTGKTSVLSALELALTGEIRSMRRHDSRYTAHLPFHGREFATLRAEVGAGLASTPEPITMTVGGSRIEGAPMLDQERADFYAERCYLDQASLGQLLELYQYREGGEDSALTRFVNELLGLEQLDALREGLADASDYRNLKKLSDSLFEADGNAKAAAGALSSATREMEAARLNLSQVEAALTHALESLGFDSQASSTQELNARADEFLRSSIQPSETRSRAAELNRSLTVLRGRIDEISSRPDVRRLEDARSVLDAVSARLEDWRVRHQGDIEGWRAEVSRLEFEGESDAESLALELRRIERIIAGQAAMETERAQVEDRLLQRQQALVELDNELSEAQIEASDMVEGLTALRNYASDNICPVCDRDFTEVSETHLTAHIDSKLTRLSEQGAQIRQLRQARDETALEIRRDELALQEIQDELLPARTLSDFRSRRDEVANLLKRLHVLQPAMRIGDDLRSQSRKARSELDDLEAVIASTAATRAELERLGHVMGVPLLDPTKSLQLTWQQLAAVSTEQMTAAEARRQRHDTATAYLEECVRALRRLSDARDAAAEAAQKKSTWDERVAEAKRLQSVARSVRDASSQARANIVERVFSESLNEVWRSVFTRLAPREPFIPAFGIPTTSKSGLELTLETVHVSGVPGGSPQMMLSAGNLNTAALSLFIALHLAVEPLVPCLVFDDPVQSMDEVHIAQFAALVRTLAKHHGRQVIIAVHERELFDYLSLELSPAFEGDELLTIELGDRSKDEDRGITRSIWQPDPSIAV